MDMTNWNFWWEISRIMKVSEKWIWLWRFMPVIRTDLHLPKRWMEWRSSHPCRQHEWADATGRSRIAMLPDSDWYLKERFAAPDRRLERNIWSNWLWDQVLNLMIWNIRRKYSCRKTNQANREKARFGSGSFILGLTQCWVLDVTESWKRMKGRNTPVVL